jgi:hypothetical protein
MKLLFTMECVFKKLVCRLSWSLFEVLRKWYVKLFDISIKYSEKLSKMFVEGTTYRRFSFNLWRTLRRAFSTSGRILAKLSIVLISINRWAYKQPKKPLAA